MKGTLKIQNAVFYAYHGVMTEEQNLGRKFEVDVELKYDFSKAAETDKLEYAVNYEKVYQALREILTENKFYLVEKLAVIIGKRILDKFINVEEVKVSVRKLHPPIGGLIDYVEASIELKR
ncbi:MAG: dihydroneopterin aldolase [Ignavibacteria bacterium]|nr:dihydroneopterin aldolase [Ignavibacteria bacterium]